MKNASLVIPTPVMGLLTRSGITVTAVAAGPEGARVRLVVPGAVSGRDRDEHLDVLVRRSTRLAGAGALARLARRPAGPGPDQGVLLVLPRASAALRRRATGLGISVLAVNPGDAGGPDGVLVLEDGTVVPVGGAAAPVQASPAGPGEAALLVLRALLLGESGPQQRLAARLGISQPRVSQVFADLRRQGLLERGPAAGTPQAPAARAWRVVDPAGLLQRWLELYPGPGGVTTYWFGLSPVREQATAAVEVLGREGTGEGRTVMVSGQVAADALAPWARPRCALVLARSGADLGAAGLTPCPPEDATLALTVPADRGVWAFPDWYGTRPEGSNALPLADPVQVLADLRRSPGPDAAQSTEVLRTWLLDRLQGVR